MNEYGFSHNPEEGLEAVETEEGLETQPEAKQVDADLKNMISQFEEQCEHVYSDPDLKGSLKELFDDAKEFIDANNRDKWLKLLKSTKDALMATDDSMEIEDTLREAKTEAINKGLLD